MHKLLARLVKRHLDPHIDLDQITRFLDALTLAFEQHDQDRSMLERSLTLTSDELNDINMELRHQLDRLGASKKQLEETLVEQHSIINSTLEAILSFGPDGTLKKTNEAGCKLFNLSEDKLRENNRKDNIRAIFDRLVNPDKFVKVLRQIESDKLVLINDHIETVDEKYYECYSAPTLLDGNYIGRIWSFRDATESKKYQAVLKHQAYHDGLTGLPNRSFLIESIDHAIALADRNNTQVDILFIDLDDFKKINDASGHQEGDRFLIHISKEIQKVIRESDTFGRLGGDEFLLMLEGTDQSEKPEDTHERILNIFSNPFQTENHKYFVTCSIGISSFPRDGESAEDLIRKADMAMYQAKRKGKNTHQYFDYSLENTAMQRMFLENDMREALIEEQFIFHYQPKVDLISGSLVGVEALIRWQKPGGKLIYPDQFIPLAEDTGLIHDITKLVIRNACKKIIDWQNGPLKDISISINVSASDFSDVHFVGDVISEVDRYKVPSSKLELELTESLFLNDIDRVKKSMNRLRESGLLLSIDDFGTGYSSFGQLQNLSIDYLKIDKSFIQNIFNNDKSRAIVKSIIDLGKNLGIKIVAEGIETHDDHVFMKEDGCHLGQGYYYSRPIPEPDLLLLASKKKLF